MPIKNINGRPPTYAVNIIQEWRYLCSTQLGSFILTPETHLFYTRYDTRDVSMIRCNRQYIFHRDCGRAGRGKKFQRMALPWIPDSVLWLYARFSIGPPKGTKHLYAWKFMNRETCRRPRKSKDKASTKKAIIILGALFFSLSAILGF